MHCNICYIDDILPLVPVCFMDTEIRKDLFNCRSKDTLCQEYELDRLTLQGLCPMGLTISELPSNLGIPVRKPRVCQNYDL